MERPFYRLIILIIDSDDPVYTVHRATWRQYMNSDPEILSLFLRCSPACEQPQLDMSANTLTFKGTESLVPGILQKTLDGFEYCLRQFSFEHILRTNISSFFVFPLLKNNILHSIPQALCYAGVRINNHYNTDFVSGAGFYISPDIAHRLVQNRGACPAHLPDDVAVGYFLTRTEDTPICSLPTQFDFVFDTDMDHDSEKLAEAAARNAYHFRIKNMYDRLRFDTHYMRLLLKTYYNRDVLIE